MCGILGMSCFNCKKKVKQIFPNLMTSGPNLTHRGPQGWGVLTSDGISDKMPIHRQEGRFDTLITERRAIALSKRMQGHVGLAHTLYSTVGKKDQKKQPMYMQPVKATFHGKPFGMSYNGNIYDLTQLRERAEKAHWKFESKISDTEVIPALIATSRKTDFVEALKEILPLLKGAFALAFMYDGKIIGARDRYGIRPLCIGASDSNIILSSESCAFYPVGANFVRDVRPGEIVVIDDSGIERSIKWTEETGCRFCIFEFVYFARPDSRLCQGKTAYYYRNLAGKILAREAPVDADLIISAPAGGDIFAEAYASELGIPFRQALFKSRGDRSFLTSRETDRRKIQRIKLHPLSEVIWGKKVCVIDDSIVRGNACYEMILMLFEAGATEVHFRSGSSTIEWPCHYGIDMSTRRELIAANYGIEQIRERIGADSLAYISREGMVKATGLPKDNLCMACFDGNYPVPPPTELN